MLKNQSKNKEKKSSTEILKKIKLFDKIAKYAVYSLIALLPISFIPSSLIELDQVKIGLMLLAVLVAIIFLGLSAFYSKSLKLISKKVLIPIILISAVTLLSSLFSTSYKGSLIGFGTELDSWYLVSILLLVAVLVSAVINTKEKIFTALSLLWASFGLASLFQLLRLLASTFKLSLISSILSLGGKFNLPELNTIGTWADFGIIAGVVSLSLAVTLDMVPLKKSIKTTAWCLFALSALMSFVASSILIGSGIDQLTNGSQFIIPTMSVVGLFALLFAIFQLRQRRRIQKQGNISGKKEMISTETSAVNTETNAVKLESIKFPIASFVLIILGLITIVSPLAINQKLNYSFGIPNESVLNVRPGISDTLEVSKGVLGSSVKNSLIGVGPHGFYIAWNQYRPAYINSLGSWNADYPFGVGYLLTDMVSVGILGFLLWIVSLITLLALGLKTILKNKGKDPSSVYTNIILLLSASFLWFNALLNISGATIVILTFIFTGLLLANLVLDKKIKIFAYPLDGVFKDFTEESLSGTGTSLWVNIKNKILLRGVAKNKVYVLVSGVLIILIICFSFIWVNRTRAQTYSAKAMQMIYAKDVNISVVPKAMELLKKSFDIYPADVYARGINNLALVQINYDISSDTTGQNMQALQNGQPVQMSSSTAIYLTTAISSGKSSIDANPNDFRNFLQFGSTMQTSALLTGEPDAGKVALQSFLKAESLARNHPLPLYSIANLYALAGDKESAKAVLEQALKVKPNFTEASDLYQKIIQDISASTTAPIVEKTISASSTKATSTKATSTKSVATPKKTTTKSVSPNSKVVKPTVNKVN